MNIEQWKANSDKAEREASRIGSQVRGFADRHPAITGFLVVAAVCVLGALFAFVLFGRSARAASMTLDCPGGQFVATTGTLTCVGAATTPPPGGGGTTPPPATDFDGCPANAVKVRGLYPVTANGVTPYAAPGQIMAIKMAVPTGAPMTGNLPMQFLGTYSGSPSGAWAISERACDLATPIIDTINTKPDKVKKMAGFVNGAFTGTYNYGPAGTGGVTKVMEVGRTYYMNIRIDACAAVATCGFEFVKLP